MRKVIVTAVVLLFGISIFFSRSFMAKSNALAPVEVNKATGCSIPDEIYKAIKIKFPFIESKAQINYINTHLNPNGEGEIALFSAFDRLNGFFILFEKKGQHYNEKYVEGTPVYSCEVTPSTSQIVFSSGLGGTGIQENKLHVIRYTPKGYSDVWNGIETSIRFASAPFIRIDGCVKTPFGDSDELIYFQLKRTYKYNNNNFALISKETTVQNFKYNEQKMKYEIVIENQN